MLRLGTRGSALARWQAAMVAAAVPTSVNVSTVIIDSQGDRDLSTPLWRINGVGVFTAALDRALLDGEIDVAVHSMKDVPTSLPEGLDILAVLARGPVHDVVIMSSPHQMQRISELELTIGTSSRRRAAQWLHRYPHHRTVPLRGNIATRLAHLNEGTMDGIIMAEAALQRLQIVPDAMERMEWMTPAPAQGAICVVGRSADHHTADMLRSIHDPDTALATSLERQFLAALDGGCSSAIGAIAVVTADEVSMRCTVHGVDGRQAIELSGRMPRGTADRLLADLVQAAIDAGAHRLIAEARHA